MNIIYLFSNKHTTLQEKIIENNFYDTVDGFI